MKYFMSFLLLFVPFSTYAANIANDNILQEMSHALTELDRILTVRHEALAKTIEVPVNKIEIPVQPAVMPTIPVYAYVPPPTHMPLATNPVTIDKPLTSNSIVKKSNVSEPLAVIPPDLKRVLKCESGMKHYNKDGTVLKSPTGDWGIMQINARYHLKAAKRLGYDIMKKADNIAYGMLLYKQRGLRPWVCARILGMI